MLSSISAPVFVSHIFLFNFPNTAAPFSVFLCVATHSSDSNVSHGAVSKLWPLASGWNRNKPMGQFPAASLSSHRSNASIGPSPTAFPLNAAWPWPATQNSPGPGCYDRGAVGTVMGELIPKSRSFALCGGPNTMSTPAQERLGANAK